MKDRRHAITPMALCLAFAIAATSAPTAALALTQAETSPAASRPVSGASWEVSLSDIGYPVSAGGDCKVTYWLKNTGSTPISGPLRISGVQSSGESIDPFYKEMTLDAASPPFLGLLRWRLSPQSVVTGCAKVRVTFSFGGIEKVQTLEGQVPQGTREAYKSQIVPKVSAKVAAGFAALPAGVAVGSHVTVPVTFESAFDMPLEVIIDGEEPIALAPGGSATTNVPMGVTSVSDDGTAAVAGLYRLHISGDPDGMFDTGYVLRDGSFAAVPVAVPEKDPDTTPDDGTDDGTDPGKPGEDDGTETPGSPDDPSAGTPGKDPETPTPDPDDTDTGQSGEAERPGNDAETSAPSDSIGSPLQESTDGRRTGGSPDDREADDGGFPAGVAVVPALGDTSGLVGLLSLPLVPGSVALFARRPRR